MILCIETATSACSAALCDETRVAGVIDGDPGKSHASQLTVVIKKLLDDASLTAGQLSAVAVSKGPGSYTGLRIGVSVAKGIAYGTQIPLIGINTLTAMCHGFLTKHPVYADHETLLCPMIDARRMEVYNAIFNSDAEMIKETSADIINEKSFNDFLAEGRVIFFGTGAEKCKTMITHPNALFIPDFTLSASYLHVPAVKAFNEKKIEDTAYFEPYYLKEFIATEPRKFLI